MKLIIYACFTILGCAVSSLPQFYTKDNRGPRSPQRAVMLSSYYGPPYRRYVPQTAMTAFASGADTIATGSYNGGAEPPMEQSPETWDTSSNDDSKNEVHKPKPSETITEVPLEEAEEEDQDPPTTIVPSTTTTRKPKRIPKRKQKPQIEDEEDEEDEEDSWPFGKPGRRGGRVPNFTFFPIMFGSSFGRSTDGGAPPGAATAIANSFSTGKGGVASSHATAFGDPETYRNWKRNLKRKGTSQNED